MHMVLFMFGLYMHLINTHCRLLCITPLNITPGSLGNRILICISEYSRGSVYACGCERSLTYLSTNWEPDIKKKFKKFPPQISFDTNQIAQESAQYQAHPHTLKHTHKRLIQRTPKIKFLVSPDEPSSLNNLYSRIPPKRHTDIQIYAQTL